MLPPPADDFEVELSRWGPESPSAPPSLADSRAYCRFLATGHYENFPVVSLLLPKPLHQHFYHVYAYCRWSDDLGDETGDPQRALALLGWWRGELEACYAGQARHPVFVALAETIREFDIPRQPLTDLLSAFEQDQTVREYDTYPQLLDYCRRSADPVGRLVLALCRKATPENFPWSDSICTGLQLANFWQDVARDFDMGRIYLPREDRERFGYTRDQLDRRETNPQFLELMRFEVDRARQLLRPWKGPGEPELDQFPFRLQVDLELFARGGERILDRIAAIGYRVWQQRPTVNRWDAATLLVKCLGHALVRRWRVRS
jgi:squalene synthase HpnC